MHLCPIRVGWHDDKQFVADAANPAPTADRIPCDALRQHTVEAAKACAWVGLAGTGPQKGTCREALRSRPTWPNLTAVCLRSNLLDVTPLQARLCTVAIMQRGLGRQL